MGHACWWLGLAETRAHVHDDAAGRGEEAAQVTHRHKAGVGRDRLKDVDGQDAVVRRGRARERLDVLDKVARDDVGVQTVHLLACRATGVDGEAFALKRVG